MKSDPESLGMELTSHEVTARIVTLRGVQVMLDRDLADFYGVKPIRLREQVKRNGGRFPADFMFQLTEDESLAMVSQIAIPSWQQLGGRMETTKPTKFHEKVKSGRLGGGSAGSDCFVGFRDFRGFLDGGVDRQGAKEEGVSEFRSFGVSEFRSFGVSEFRSFGVSEFRSRSH